MRVRRKSNMYEYKDVGDAKQNNNNIFAARILSRSKAAKSYESYRYFKLCILINDSELPRSKTKFKINGIFNFKKKIK